MLWASASLIELQGSELTFGLVYAGIWLVYAGIWLVYAGVWLVYAGIWMLY